MDDLNNLGIDRMIRRAFESSTASDKAAVKKWHEAESEAARRTNEGKAKQFGYKHAACLCCGNHDTPVCETC